MPDLSLGQLLTDYVIPWSLNVLFALAIFLVGRYVVNIITKVIRALLSKRKLDDMLVDFLMGILRAVLVLFIIIAALDQLGIDTTSLIALLAAAGLAVALALKDSIKNFAAGVLLIMFRPFKAGDYVEAGGTAGTVENIDIFRTVLRTSDNREVIVPNGAIYDRNITNYSARPTRRIDMTFGIGHQDDLRQARELIAQVIEADERILTDPAPLIAIAELRGNSVNFAVRPWVKTPDYSSVRFDLNEKIKLAFDNAGISIRFP